LMHGVRKRRLRRTCSMPQGRVIEDNAADDAFMVTQGLRACLY
jgi:hypothetical protein